MNHTDLEKNLHMRNKMLHLFPETSVNLMHAPDLNNGPNHAEIARQRIGS